MKNKMVGIFICMLFLFSTLPTVADSNLDKNKEVLLPMTNNADMIIFTIIYGLIVYNGEELVDDLGMCYNVTPINVRVLGVQWKSGEGFSSEYGKITEDPLYIPQNILWPKYVGKHFMFILEYSSA